MEKKKAKLEKKNESNFGKKRKKTKKKEGKLEKKRGKNTVNYCCNPQ